MVGQYVIHVGELLATGGTLSFPQAPWGRTSSSDFQVALSEEFHCILSASLPRFPFSRDYITVWKRTKWIHGMTYLIIIILCTSYVSYYILLHLRYLILPYMIGKDHAITGDDEDLWAQIPVNERIDYTIAAPCVAHLLEK